jgi:hypothetical protein
MFFLLLYARVIHSLRRSLSRRGLLPKLDGWARQSRAGLWIRSLLSVLDFDDFRGLDVPWWTLKAGGEVAHFLEQNPQAKVLEWGSGASTLWLATRSGSVISIESDPTWAKQVREVLPHNVTLLEPPVTKVTETPVTRSKRMGFRHHEFRHYVAAIDAIPGYFDLIVIDGRAREACFGIARERLAPGGLILFDNTNRLRYRRALAKYRSQFVITSHVGLTPILPWPSKTSLIQLDTRYAATASLTPTRHSAAS